MAARKLLRQKPLRHIDIGNNPAYPSSMQDAEAFLLAVHRLEWMESVKAAVCERLAQQAESGAAEIRLERESVEQALAVIREVLDDLFEPHGSRNRVICEAFL